MATQDKLNYFYNSTMTALKEMNDKDLDNMKAKLAQELEGYKKTHAKEMRNQELQHEDEIKRELLKELASEKLRLRREQSRREAAVRDKLFEEVAAVLEETRKTSEYPKVLTEMIKSVKEFAGDDECIIYMCPDDAALKEEIEAAAGCSVQISEVPFSGGIQAEIPSRNIFINDSFSSKMAEEKEAYTVKA